MTKAARNYVDKNARMTAVDYLEITIGNARGLLHVMVDAQVLVIDGSFRITRKFTALSQP
jgi:precorrin-6B methylase 2